MFLTRCVQDPSQSRDISVVHRKLSENVSLPSVLFKINPDKSIQSHYCTLFLNYIPPHRSSQLKTHYK